MLNNKAIFSVILAGVLVVLVWFSGPAHASLHLTYRENENSINFSNPLTFDNAVLTYNIWQLWNADVAGDSWSNYTFVMPSGYYNASWTSFSSSDIGVTNVVQTSTSISATIRSYTTNYGWTSLTADINASNDFPFKTGMTGGFYFLEAKFTSAGGVDDGNQYIWQMTLPGDWSAVGTAPGQHELLSINPAWIVDSNFTFDGTNTLFRARIDNYVLGNNIDIDFILHGGPVVVPLPGSLLLLGSGLLGLLGVGRFRKA